jgi:phosphatidylinositol dimannoside acyltransferase
MTPGKGTGKGLDAPHRRREQGRPVAGVAGLRLGVRRATGRLGGRTVERLAVSAYAAAVWIVAHVPPRLARGVIGTGSQAGYRLWSTKRAWSNANFGRVMGLPPDDPKVRRLALSAYREYAKYLVEVMRLEGLSVDEAIARVVQPDLDRIEQEWRGSPGGLIFALGHVGNNEAVAAGVADRGWPISVVADDSSFPEMFDRFRRLREAWGVHVIPWRNLREIYAVLKRGEMLALLIDWGYRRDGIPVQLFGAWTTLPAGPASLAAKTRSRILPVAIRRGPDDMFHVTFSPTITVASGSDADIARATQEIAAALQATIAAAPQQWYSFKPMWPPTEEEASELAARGARMLAGEGQPRTKPPTADPIDLLAPTIDDGPGAGDPDMIKAVEGAPS